MTFIVQSEKDRQRRTDIRASADVAVRLARELLGDGYSVSITDPDGEVHAADRLDFLLSEQGSNPRE